MYHKTLTITHHQGNPSSCLGFPCMLPFNQGSIRDYSKRKQNETLIGSNKKEAIKVRLMIRSILIQENNFQESML
ncbi:MAG: hypothetical protein EBQ87_15620 [Planctomycetes bacterium]|nr:hypothetical protein [Planctomycetota bacterium]